MIARPKVTAADVEISTARMFGYRQSLIVPNVSWGFGLSYEADMVVLRSSGWAMEVEIKVTAADIRADQKKRHTHGDNRFRMLFFAVPDFLANNPDIPSRAGIISVCNERARITRAPAVNKLARKLLPREVEKLKDLAAMRIWSLKQHLLRSLRAADYWHEKYTKAKGETK